MTSCACRRSQPAHVKRPSAGLFCDAKLVGVAIFFIATFISCGGGGHDRTTIPLTVRADASLNLQDIRSMPSELVLNNSWFASKRWTALNAAVAFRYGKTAPGKLIARIVLYDTAGVRYETTRELLHNPLAYPGDTELLSADAIHREYLPGTLGAEISLRGETTGAPVPKNQTAERIVTSVEDNAQTSNMPELFLRSRTFESAERYSPARVILHLALRNSTSKKIHAYRVMAELLDPDGNVLDSSEIPLVCGTCVGKTPDLNPSETTSRLEKIWSRKIQRESEIRAVRFRLKAIRFADET